MICERCEGGNAVDTPVGALCFMCLAYQMYPWVGGEDFVNSYTIPPTEFVDESTPTKKKHTVPTGERTVGIEIEGEWTPKAAYQLMCDVRCSRKRDHSLRGRDSFEVVSPVLKTSNYKRWLDTVPLYGLNANTRCGEHIWIGTKDKGWREINKLLYLCRKREREFVSMVSPTREPFPHRDLGGRPMQITWEPFVYRTKAGFLRSLYGTTDLWDGDCRSRMQASKRANDREGHEYPGPINRTWWCNVHGHFTTRRAVEIRLLHTTNVQAIIEAWIDMWVYIIDNIDKYTLEELAVIPLEKLTPRRSRVLFKAKEYNKDLVLQQSGYTMKGSQQVIDLVSKFIKEEGLCAA